VSNSKTESKSRPKPNPPLDSRRHPKSAIAAPQVHDIALRHLGRNLDLAFYDRFDTPLPETLNENHTMVIIASACDAASQRIVRYLSETHNIAINTALHRLR
jgi:hypothetical protein